MHEQLDSTTELQQLAMCKVQLRQLCVHVFGLQNMVATSSDYISIKVLSHPESHIKRNTSIIAAIWAYLLNSLGVFGRRFSGRDFPKKFPARIPLLHRPAVFHPPGKQAPIRRDNYHYT